MSLEQANASYNAEYEYFKSLYVNYNAKHDHVIAQRGMSEEPGNLFLIQAEQEYKEACEQYKTSVNKMLALQNQIVGLEEKAIEGPQPSANPKIVIRQKIIEAGEQVQKALNKAKEFDAHLMDHFCCLHAAREALLEEASAGNVEVTSNAARILCDTYVTMFNPSASYARKAQALNALDRAILDGRYMREDTKIALIAGATTFVLSAIIAAFTCATAGIPVALLVFVGSWALTCIAGGLIADCLTRNNPKIKRQEALTSCHNLLSFWHRTHFEPAPTTTATSSAAPARHERRRSSTPPTSFLATAVQPYTYGGENWGDWAESSFGM